MKELPVPQLPTTDARPATRSVAVRRPIAARGQRRWPLRRIGLALLALLLVVGVGMLGVVGWQGSEKAIHRAPKAYGWQVADYPGLQPQEVTIPSRTGIQLAGTFYPGDSRATIVLSHGYGDQQEQMLPWAAFLHRAGYNVFTYDMRARGRSGGDAITLGALEQEDLRSVVDYLVARPDVDPGRIGALGVSLGGATTLLAAARDPRITAVVDDCGFSDAAGTIDTGFEYFVGLPAFPFGPISLKIAELRTGQPIGRVRPVDEVARISPRPLFVIHGLADPYVPPANSERNFAAAGEPKEVWWVPDAGHNSSREVAGAEYERRVADFFLRSLPR